MIKWIRNLLVLGLIFVFSSVLTSAQFDGGELEAGEEVEVEVDGEDQIEFTYNGSEGEVITITVDAQDDTDTRMIIYNEDGDEIASDDDSGAGTNPALVRIQLPEDGEYSIVLEHFSEDEVLEDEFEVTLVQTELLDLNAGPQTVVVGGDYEVERMVLNAEDANYIVSITIADSYDSTLYVYLLQEDEFFAGTRVDMAGTSGVAFLFEPEDDGLVEFELEYFGFSDEVEVTVEAELDE